LNGKPRSSDHHPAYNWVGALRPWTLIVVLFPCTLGIVLGSEHSQGSRLNTTLLLITAVLLQFGANMLGDFFQFGGPTRRSSRRRSVFGPDRTRVEWIVFLSGIACFFLAVPFGMILVYRAGLPLLLLGLIGIAAGYFYTGEPVHFKRRGLGVLAAFLFLGLLTVAGAAYAVSGSISGQTFLVSVPPGLLAAALLLEDEILDIDSDRSAGIGTFAVRIGRLPAAWTLAALILPAYLWPLLLGLLPPPIRPGTQIWLIYAALPFAAASVIGVAGRKPAGHRPVPWMLVHHYLYGALYVLAFAVGSAR